jgi:PAS domain S-box-containing protein
MVDPVALSWGPLLEAHPLAHFVYDPVSLQLLAANDAALARYGCTREQFTRLNRVDLLLPEEAPALRAFLAALPASAMAPQQRVWRERTLDGRVLHADIRGMPVLFEGRPARLAAVVDAGSRARLEADAAGARDLLVTAGRMAHVGGWSLDLRARTVRWSDVVCALHEVPLGTECGLELALAFYPGRARPALAAAVRACASAGTPFDLELPFVGARGTPRWVRVAGAAARDEAGAIVAVEGAQQDITRRKQDELALAESRSRLAALLGAIPDLWIVIDAEERYAEVSDPAHPGLSTAWADKLGRRVADCMDAASYATVHALIEAAHASGRPQSYTYEQRTGAGELRSFEGRVVALSGGRSFKLIRDITEVTELERRFRAMADAAPVGIYMTDAQGNCTYTNPPWQQLYGLAYETSLGRAWLAVLHPGDRARVFAGLATAASQPLEMEFRLCPRDLPERTVVARCSPIYDADRRVTAYVGTVVDVTQARELEAARRAQAVAEEAGRRQADFMSRVSHELRTPLNAILGFGQLLEQAVSTDVERSRSHARHVVQAGRHMLALVDDLLQLQRLAQGAFELQRRPLDLVALLASCVEMMRPGAEAAGVELQVDTPPSLQVDSDERCLRQMLLNLASNALKYGRQGPGPHRVSFAVRVEGARAMVTVTDRGPGMTATQLQRLFRPFERLGQEAGHLPGSGLGLVITRQIAQALGAEVALESAPGRGTVATLRLPL